MPQRGRTRGPCRGPEECEDPARETKKGNQECHIMKAKNGGCFRLREGPPARHVGPGPAETGGQRWDCRRRQEVKARASPRTGDSHVGWRVGFAKGSCPSWRGPGRSGRRARRRRTVHPLGHSFIHSFVHSENL